MAVYLQSGFGQEVDELCEALFRPFGTCAIEHLLGADAGPVVSALGNRALLSHGMIISAVERGVRRDGFCGTFSRLQIPIGFVSSDEKECNKEDIYTSGVLLGAAVGVSEIPAGMLSACGRTTVGRFLYDGKRLEQVGVDSLDWDPSMVMVTFWKPTSSIGVRQIFGLFSRQRFEAAVRTRSKSLLSSSLAISFSRFLVHNCALCSKPPHALCGCALPKLPPLQFQPLYSDILFRSGSRSQGQLCIRFNPSISIRRVRDSMKWFKAQQDGTFSNDLSLWEHQVEHELKCSNKDREKSEIAHIGIGFMFQRHPLPISKLKSVTSCDRPWPHARPIHPRKHADGSGSQHSSGDHVHAQHPRDELIRKRKERNRAAAARANAKRKQALADLRRNLADAKRDAERLEHVKSGLEHDNRLLTLSLARQHCANRESRCITSADAAQSASL